MKKDQLLKIIVEDYIKSAKPVGSKLIVEKYFPTVSSATIRNYMADLEKQGLISKSHTSAGRVPTADGYQYYVDNLLAEKKIKPETKPTVKIKEKKAISTGKQVEDVKSLVKKIAELSGGAVMASLDSGEVYYTGLSNLFSQPEFAEQELAISISEVMDHLDEVFGDICKEVKNQIEILIGENNPFGAESSVILSRYQLGDKSGLIGILGPSRMDYQKNIDLLDQIDELFN